MKKKGTITLYIVWFVIAVIIVVMASIMAPLGVTFNAEMLAAGESMMRQSNDSINRIQDATIRNDVHNLLDDALDDAELNIQVNSDIFQYSWVIVLIVSALVLFLYSRQLVEYGGYV